MNLKKKHHYEYVFWCRCVVRFKNSGEVKEFTIILAYHKPHLNIDDMRQLEEDIKDRLLEDDPGVEKVFMKDFKLLRKKRIG